MIDKEEIQRAVVDVKSVGNRFEDTFAMKILLELTELYLAGKIGELATKEEIVKNIELAISEIDKIPVDEQKNVLGDKNKYIKGISEALIGKVGK